MVTGVSVGPTPAQQAAIVSAFERDWGRRGDSALQIPSADPRFAEQFATLCRFPQSPGAALTLLKMNLKIDVRAILPMLSVPTLILHRVGDHRVDVGSSRYLAERITGAKYVELPGIDHYMWLGDDDPVTDEIEVFLTGTRPSIEIDRALATVLFTDIVGSTERLAELGDRR